MAALLYELDIDAAPIVIACALELLAAARDADAALLPEEVKKEVEKFAAVVGEYIEFSDWLNLEDMRSMGSGTSRLVTAGEWGSGVPTRAS